ncbi:MAG: glycoside hydrolase family 127 protein [Bacteroidales bacterium]
MKKTALTLIFLVFLITWACKNEPASRDYPIQPLPFTSVSVADSFWLPRIETNRITTIPFAFHKSEETGRISNFAVAGKIKEGGFCSKYGYDDSDVYKIIEGAAYSLSTHPDPALEAYLDSLALLISRAQEPDGYLYTMRTIDSAKSWAKDRWLNDPVGSHELYNVGHFYEAAVAHYAATGKRTLLDVAIRNADLLVKSFGPDKLHITPGHPETEIGLIKLYRATGNPAYLTLARFFIDQRGKRDSLANPKYYREYILTHKPLLEQEEAVGHAVRALYLYSGATDIAAIMGDQDYLAAMDRLWEDVVFRKMYVTGGIGAWPTWEAFGPPYALPNDTAYAETCAAIANVLWNQRMFLLHGDSKYIDVLERSLYNGALSGISLGGNLFFYPNPLYSDGHSNFNMGTCTRQEWFDCSCCPSNLARFLPSIPGYMYAVKKDTVYTNLFIAGKASLQVHGKNLTIEQQTRYPWEGQVKLLVHASEPVQAVMAVRIPGWARNQPSPGDLYTYLGIPENETIIKVNGTAGEVMVDKGYAIIKKDWKEGDVIAIDFPMEVRKVLANEAVSVDRGKLALERGPLVYCLEQADNGKGLADISVNDRTAFTASFEPDLLDGLVVLKGEGKLRDKKQVPLKAIPYFAWSNRGCGEMTVWMNREPEISNKNK